VESMRWIRGLVPLAAVALMGAGAGARPPVLGAVDPPWEPPPCSQSGSPVGPGGAVPALADAVPGAAWYRLDARLDEEGTLDGHELVVAIGDGPERALRLPSEAFATGPREGIVLVGEDDGSRSRLSLLDVGRGCRTAIAEEASVIRSALLAPDGGSIVEHRVDRRTRADLGVWRRPVDGTRPRRLLAGAPDDGRYGRTFSTELRAAGDGRIVATSCGEQACRTRVLDPGSKRVTTVGPTGPVIGIARDGGVVAYDPCPGFPCSVSIHASGLAPRVLVPAAGRASAAGDTLVFEVAPGRLAALDIATGSLASLDGEGLVPLAESSKAGAGADHGPGTAVLARDGRMDRGGVLLPAGSRTPASLGEGVR
jgi:hypothetical protein